MSTTAVAHLELGISPRIFKKCKTALTEYLGAWVGGNCTVKKVHEFPVFSRDVTKQTPPGQELFSYDVIIPAQGEFGSDIPAGDGKLANLFFTV